MEVDHEFLWISEKKKYLKSFVENLFNKLNDPLSLIDGNFCIPLDHYNSFTFQFSPKKEKQQDVRNYDVPIFLNSESELRYNEIVELTSDIL